MRVEPLTPAHLEALTLQPAQRAWRETMSRDQFDALAAGDAWTALVGDRVVGCGGLIELSYGRAEAWALIAGDAGPHMALITRAVRRFLSASPVRRIEAVTAVNFPPARRWAKMLGFRFEGVMTSYLDDGSDAERWAMVR